MSDPVYLPDLLDQEAYALAQDDLHRLYRLCQKCGRWIRRTDTEAWNLHREEFCPERES